LIVAKKFNEMGITAFVLKYRIPDDAVMDDKTTAPLRDRAASYENRSRQCGKVEYQTGPYRHYGFFCRWPISQQQKGHTIKKV
jgi:hypothetical protein